MIAKCSKDAEQAIKLYDTNHLYNNIQKKYFEKLQDSLDLLSKLQKGRYL